MIPKTPVSKTLMLPRTFPHNQKVLFLQNDKESFNDKATTYILV